MINYWASIAVEYLREKKQLQKKVQRYGTYFSRFANWLDALNDKFRWQMFEQNLKRVHRVIDALEFWEPLRSRSRNFS